MSHHEPSPQRQPSRMLSVKDAAEQLNVSPSTIYALISTGKLSCHRVGAGRGVIRISETGIADYLADCANQVSGARSEPAHRPVIRLKHIKL